MQKFLAAFFVIAGFSVPLTYGVAQATPASKTKTVKKPVKKTVKKTPVSENSQKETEVVNVAGLTGSHYNCELGNQFTVYKHFCSFDICGQLTPGKWVCDRKHSVKAHGRNCSFQFLKMRFIGNI